MAVALTLCISPFVAVPVQASGSLLNFSGTFTRLKAGATTNITNRFTLPAGVDFDASGGLDAFVLPNASWLSSSGVPGTSVYGVNDGTARSVQVVQFGPGLTTPTCTDGANNVGVAIDTNTLTSRIVPCGTSFVASATGATVTLTFTSTGGYSIILTSTPGTYVGPMSFTDEGVSSAYSASGAVAIVDDDQVSVTASVDPSLTFDLDTGIGDNANGGAPYSVALGTLSTSSVSTSNGSSVGQIGVDLATNASSGAVVTVKDANNGLKSTSTPGDAIPAVSSTTLVAGTAGYGICVDKVTASTSSTLRSAGFHNGGTLSANGTTSTSATCTSSAHQIATGLSTTAQNILDTAGAPGQGGRAEIFVKAAISPLTPAHTDYADTLIFVATATF